MATSTVREIIRFRGRLVANPTDLTAAFPHGGISLGLVRDAELDLEVKSREITAEEYGNNVVEKIYAGERAVFLAVLRGLDSDMVTKVFPNATAATGQFPTVTYAPASTATPRPGFLASANAFKLAFCPIDAPDHAPFFVMYKALPLIDTAVKMQLALNAEMGIAVAFVGVPDTTKGGKVYQFGGRAEVAL